eukprot:1816851-Ditylum_brightwellii.AAC.1
MKTSQLQNMMMLTQIMKTQMIHHRNKTKTSHPMTPPIQSSGMNMNLPDHSSIQLNSLTSFKSYSHALEKNIFNISTVL